VLNTWDEATTALRRHDDGARFAAIKSEILSVFGLCERKACDYIISCRTKSLKVGVTLRYAGRSDYK
jgi:hypothetical protein